MQKIYTSFQRLLFMLLLSILMMGVFPQNKTYAAVGDTIVVQAHNSVHMNYHGNFDAWAVFPSDTFHFSKVLMKYTLGCATTGCAA